MGWPGRWTGGSFDPDAEIVERLTTVRRFPPRVERETASLSDRATVQGWIRSLRPEHDAQVHVRRHWGVLAVVADRKNPITVVVSDSQHSYFAARPDADQGAELTINEVEHLVVEALTSQERPAWPRWEQLT